MNISGQILLNSLIGAAFGGLMAHAVLPTFRLSRYFDLSIAATALISGYVLCLIAKSALPMPIACLAAILIAAMVHVAIKLIVPDWLLPQASSSSLLLVSFGVYVCLISIMSLIFGAELIPAPYAQAGIVWQTPLGRITAAQAMVVVVAILLPISYSVLLAVTRVGRALRATSSSLELARISGIALKPMALIAVFLSGLSAALAGTCLCLDVGVRPTAGLQPILIGVVAVVVGGRWGMFGVSMAAALISLLQNLVAANWGPQWQDVVAFAVLAAALFLNGKRGVHLPIRSQEKAQQ